jgi:hypothetical protein
MLLDDSSNLWEKAGGTEKEAANSNSPVFKKWAVALEYCWWTVVVWGKRLEDRERACKFKQTSFLKVGCCN